MKVWFCIFLVLCCLSGCQRKEKEVAQPVGGEISRYLQSTEVEHGRNLLKEKTEEMRVKKEEEEKAAEEAQKKAMKAERLVAIDAGHQGKGDSAQEPIGPGASEMKARVSSGTCGVSTGINEFELNLTVSLKLQQELEDRGYRVVMTRTTHDVSMSNAERAAIANDAQADIFVRIHANGSEDSSREGALTMCMTPQNPYNGNLYTQSRQLSEVILDEICRATQAQRESIIETDTMSGINWCGVPVTIVEMGYMTNPEEDRRLNDEAYQKQMVMGIANGIDRYFDTF
ncbi:MAG: N-acetylmuramoyl-L-alanine amidase [Hespellia sp.]|nr:N-acetylmuramoyl-L-alanine amidase [Hespellia sp.]